MNPPVLTVKSVFDQAHEITSPAERRAYLDEACAGDSDLRQKVEALLAAYEAIRSGSFLQTPAPGVGDTGPYQLGAATSGEAPLDEGATVPPQPGTQPVSQIEGTGTRIGPYTLIKELGEGGMGAVYLAEQEKPIRRQVALKIIKPGMDSAAVVARFEAERQALTMMDHPNIARVFEAGTTAAGRPYFVMELVGGTPMTRFCNEHRLTIRERLQLFATVCEAMQHAHAKGVMHRDIKPGNVLVAMQDGKPVPKVIDFGLAKAMGPSLTDETQLTQLGAIVGTLEYMSPEQADPGGPGVDTATDIYSLGVMLYELLTGTTPLDLASTRGTGGMLEVVLRIHEEDPPRPSTRVAELGDRQPAVAAERRTEPARLAKLLRGELDWIALKALEKDRRRRYETASGFARDVQRYLSDEPVEACPPTLGYRVGKFVRKNRVLVAVVSLLLAVLVLGSGGLAVAFARENKLRREAETARDGMRKSFRTTDAMLKKWLRDRSSLGDVEKSFLRDLIPVYTAFLGESGDSKVARLTVAETQFTLANIFALLGEGAEADERYLIAIQLYEKLVRDFPDLTQYRNDLASCHFNRAVAFHMGRVYPEAEASYRRSIEINEQLVSEFASEQSYRSNLANGYYNLGAFFRDVKDPAKAEKALRQAIALRAKLVGFPSEVGYRINLARDYLNLGNAIRDQGKARAALPSYNQAVKLLNPIPRRPADANLVLRSVAWDRANALGQLARHEEANMRHEEAIMRQEQAIKQWQNALLLDDGTERVNLQLFLAADESELNLRMRPGPAGEVLYEAAVVYARANVAAKRTREASQEERYARRAQELLKQAQSAGWFRDPQRIKQLKAEKSFNSLPRDELKRFLESLDASPVPKDRPAKE
jgi:serine/threonine protein kinase/tetratricopeptide (TPR) repeat protein